MQTHLTHRNTIFKYSHASINFDNVDVLLEDGNVYQYIDNGYRPVLKNKTATMFFLKKRFSSLYFCLGLYVHALNKAYRPNTPLLDILMHCYINII